MWSNKKSSDRMIPHHIWVVIPERSRCYLSSTKIIVPSLPPSNIVVMNIHPIQIMLTSQIMHIYVITTLYRTAQEYAIVTKTASKHNQVHTIALCGNI